MKRNLLAMTFSLLVFCHAAKAEVASDSMNVHWREGAPTCTASTEPSLQVHAYNSQTYILRESLCVTFEAPFMYLLIGSKQALLVDTGDVADPKQVPLAETVMRLLPLDGSGKMPLLVVHTHRHLDHRAGDSQFSGLPGVHVVGFDLQSVRQFYQFANWPDGTAQIDLGGRTVDAIPTPGHNETEVTFYDRNTGLLLTGDFLLPARILVDDSRAYRASAERVADFVKDRPVTYVLGGHIEMDNEGHLYSWQSQYHPHEHALQLTKNDVTALPIAANQFNGFYTRSGDFVFMDSFRILEALAVAVIFFLGAGVWLLIRRRRRRTANALSRVRAAAPPPV